MKTIITATAPTVYQLDALRHFGMGFNKNLNGSYSASMEFDSEEDAKDYLKGKAEQYNFDDPNGSEERLMIMYHDIEKGVIRLLKEAIEQAKERLKFENK